jgi:RNA recognition motif-containing protein
VLTSASIGYSERVDISVDPFSGRNPSYCFVELASKDQAERAMVELDGHDLMGRAIKVKPGVAKSGTNERSFQRSGDGGVSSPRTYNDRNPQSAGNDRWQRNEGSSQSKVSSEQGRRLYVGGLPKLPDQEVLENDLRNFFTGYRM